MSILATVDMLRWRGPKLCFVIAIRELLRPLCYWYTFHIVVAPAAPAEESPAVPSGFQVKIFDQENDVEFIETKLAGLLTQHPVDVKLRLARGEAVAVAYAGATPAGFCWIARRNGLDLVMQTAWIIRPDEAVVHDSFVLPEWRGKGLHRCLDGAVGVYLHEKGVRRVMGSMSALNPQTLSLARRHNKTLLMTITLVKFRALPWVWRHVSGAPLQSQFYVYGEPKEPVLSQ